MINGACYIRVSTGDQTEYSPDAQLRIMRDYAGKNDIFLRSEHIYMDEGLSGKRADKRPAFMKMIAAAKTTPKPFDVILVHKFDRFARSREDSVVYKSLLKKEAGVRVVSVTESIDGDRFSVILEAMLEAMAEYYSLNLADEVKKGMTEKARRGELQSAPPFGYKAENGKLVIVPGEAGLVAFIFEQFASHKMTARQLAGYMNGIGVKTRRAKAFESRSVEYILNNPVYIGKLRWTPTGKAGRDFRHPDTILRDGAHEPIINPALWQRAREAMERRETVQPRGTRAEGLLRTWLKGLVRCGNCGKLLSATKRGYFQCNGYARGRCKPSACIGVNRLESLVLESLKKTFIESLEIHVSPMEMQAGAAKEYEVLNEKLKKLDFREERIRTAYQDGADTIAEYRANKKTVLAERQNATENMQRLLKALSSRGSGESVIISKDSVHALLTDGTVSMDVKYKAARFLIKSVTYTKSKNELIIEYI